MLKPEDVQNKNFTATKFTRGYNELEVDDFMDEVASSLRDLYADNERLRAMPVHPIVSSTRPTPPDAGPIVLNGNLALMEQPVIEGPSPAGLLALAQKVHDQYVEEGKQVRDQLIAEGEATRTEAKRQISEMRERASGIVAEARETAAKVISALVHEREALDAQIAHLRVFEADHREGLQTYMEGQLAELTQLGNGA